MKLSPQLFVDQSDLKEGTRNINSMAKDEEEDILSIFGKIFATYNDIYSKHIGPWSEVSESMEQERAANRFIAGLNKKKIKKKFVDEFQRSEEPWRFFDYIARNYNKMGWGQHHKFFNSIVKSKHVRAILLARISEIIPFLIKEKEPMKKLTILIWLNTEIRENEQVKEIVTAQFEKGEKLEPYVLSKSMILAKEEAQIIKDLEKVAGNIPHLQDKFKVKIRKVTYGISASSRIKRGFYVEDRHIVGLGITDLKLKKIPASIGGLTKLRLLCLNTNQLKTLPASLGNLTNLEGLYLDSNKLTKLPTSIGKLINLQEIYVRENNLKVLPDSIGNLKLLRKLMIDGNPLNELPPGIANLLKLEDLEIQNTNLRAKDIKYLSQNKKLGLKFLYFVIADNFMYKGKQGEAAEAYEELLKLDPEYSDMARYNLGNYLNNQGKYEKAEKYLKDAESFKSFKVEALISLGYSYYYRNLLQEAEETFGLALKNDKKKKHQGLLLLNIGGLYLKQHKWDEAEKILLKGIKMKEYEGDICYNLACLYSLKKQEKECLNYLENAIKSGAALLSGIDQDTDFKFMRSNSKFITLVSKLKSGRKEEKELILKNKNP